MDWKQSGAYRFLRGAVQLFTKKISTTWKTPFKGGPSIFVCNHDRAYGPIAMCAHFELYREIRPWINSPVLSAKELPAYVRQDYWWKPDKWYSKILDYTLPYLIALIIPPINRGSACIPVYHDSRVIKTMRASVDALKNGKHIILFPESPSGYCRYEDEIVSGFVSLSRIFYRRTKQAVRFYPTFVDWKGKNISVAEPIIYNPEINFVEFVNKVSDKVENHFRECEENKLNK